MKKAQTIFFDESGYTGNNLLSLDQPAFVYASVAIDLSDASMLHSEMFSRFKLKGEELKAKNLVKHKQGREAVSWLLNECKDVASIVVANKNLALAGKFFEYIFEPVLKTHNSWFYAVGFHNFVANFLYMLSAAKDKRAEYVLSRFEKLMRTLDADDLEQLLNNSYPNLFDLVKGNQHLNEMFQFYFQFLLMQLQNGSQNYLFLRGLLFVLKPNHKNQ